MTCDDMFVWRNNLDVLRHALRMGSGVALWITFGRMRRGRLGRWFRAVTLALYLIVAICAVLRSEMRAMYQLDPQFLRPVAAVSGDGIEFVLVARKFRRRVYWPRLSRWIVVVWCWRDSTWLSSARKRRG